MSISKQVSGKHGEDLAVTFLRRKGFTIIERNFRIRGGEIDIIALDQGVLVFIEVKTRSSSEFGTPLEAITYWKLKALIKTAQVYKAKNPRLPDALRIDAVAVSLDSGDNLLSIELVKNISAG